MQCLCEEFENRNIPIPLNHSGGDIVVSNELFPDNTRILIALVFGMHTAYRVCLDKAGGSLKPKSYRLLLDYCSSLINMSDLIRVQDKKFGLNYVKSYLFDIGDERFCVIYSSPRIPLLVYVFQMDFYVEYENQLGQSASKPSIPSIRIQSSKNFNFLDIHNFEILIGLCLCI